jgi:hypothetical protein
MSESRALAEARVRVRLWFRRQVLMAIAPLKLGPKTERRQLSAITLPPPRVGKPKRMLFTEEYLDSLGGIGKEDRLGRPRLVADRRKARALRGEGLTCARSPRRWASATPPHTAS